MIPKETLKLPPPLHQQVFVQRALAAQTEDFSRNDYSCHHANALWEKVKHSALDDSLHLAVFSDILRGPIGRLPGLTAYQWQRARHCVRVRVFFFYIF